MKTLDEHIRHVDNFKKYRGYKTQYEKLYAEDAQRAINPPQKSLEQGLEI